MRARVLALVALLSTAAPAQKVEEAPAQEEAPVQEEAPAPHVASPYRIFRVHLLPGPTGSQAAVSRGRFVVNFGSREGVQPGSIFKVLDRGRLMGLVRVDQVWRDSASVRLINLLHKDSADSPNPLETGYYLEPKFVLLVTIHFALGKPDISPEMHEHLRYAARFVRSFPDFPLVLEGHTDALGKPEDNLKLSRERAEAIRLFLHEVYRIPTAQIHTSGYGQTRPIATNSTESGRYLNRRVDIILTDEKP